MSPGHMLIQQGIDFRMDLFQYAVSLRLKWRDVLLAFGIGGGMTVYSNYNVCKQPNLPNTLNCTGFLVWGLVCSVQAPFYTNEALKRGANLSQVEFQYNIT